MPFSCLLAGVIAFLAAHSYRKLTLHFGEKGGVFAFVEHAVDNPHWARATRHLGVCNEGWGSPPDLPLTHRRAHSAVPRRTRRCPSRPKPPARS